MACRQLEKYISVRNVKTESRNHVPYNNLACPVYLLHPSRSIMDRPIAPARDRPDRKAIEIKLFRRGSLLIFERDASTCRVVRGCSHYRYLIRLDDCRVASTPEPYQELNQMCVYCEFHRICPLSSVRCLAESE